MNATTVTTKGPPRKRLRDPFAVLYWLLAAGVFTFLFAPIVVIVIYSFNDGRLLGAWQGFGFKAYHRAVTDQTIRDAVKISLISGVFASLVATTLGTIGGVLLARTRSKWALILTALLAITLVTPEIIDAVSILPWFVTLGTDGHLLIFNNGLVRLVIVHTSVALATVTFMVQARMAGMDPAIEEAASDLYASAWNQMLPTGHLADGSPQHHGRSLDGLHPEPGTTPWCHHSWLCLAIHRGRSTSSAPSVRACDPKWQRSPH
ncbi:MAG: hypothetical protein R2693_14225 [Nocardioidaceae bacterium]